MTGAEGLAPYSDEVQQPQQSAPIEASLVVPGRPRMMPSATAQPPVRLIEAITTEAAATTGGPPPRTLRQSRTGAPVVAALPSWPLSSSRRRLAAPLPALRLMPGAQRRTGRAAWRPVPAHRTPGKRPSRTTRAARMEPTIRQLQALAGRAGLGDALDRRQRREWTCQGAASPRPPGGLPHGGPGAELREIAWQCRRGLPRATAWSDWRQVEGMPHEPRRVVENNPGRQSGAPSASVEHTDP